MEEIDPRELSKFNGKDGNPVYIVHRGRVFDVSASPLWKTGLHMNRHQAGKDLTTDIQAAPHGLEVLERYPQVATVKQEPPAERPIPNFLASLLKRFPMLRRHPHPMTIHFPIVFMFSAPLFTILFFLTGIRSFETTAWHCLGGGLLFTPVAIGTGYYTWWLNYQARSLRPVRIKKKVSLVLLGTAMIAMLWRILDPAIVISPGPARWIYLILVFSLLPLVSVMGWFGAQMTFPIERDPLSEDGKEKV
ncbi:MAG: cytochrome b5 [Deltaproteobacteria bacterium]|nr:cytochrome b5 [Deltaproteobacteria bacterium]